MTTSAHLAQLIVCDAYRAYDFGHEHPLIPRRLDVGLDLLRTSGLLHPGQETCPPPATDSELQLIHTPTYVEALSRLSQWAPLLEAPLVAEARRYGLGPGDNPLFPGAHEAAAAIAGGSLHTALTLMEHPTVRHAFHPMGGLHHALPDRASGFCLYNDPALAIAAALNRYEARVLYVDFDVHHGDGVQRCFDDDPRVLTVSFHESGQYLFPGSGDVLDLGRAAGRGSAVNLPMMPSTTDRSWLEAVETVLPALAERFRPDLIVSQHGCDTHAWDPLAHLQLTTQAFEVQAQLLHELAHRYCQGRWLACGGGGYDVYRVVPRSWALIWGQMTDQTVPAAVPHAWQTHWQGESEYALPANMRDADGDVAFSESPAAEAASRNRATLEHARRVILTAPERLLHPLPAIRSPENVFAPAIARLTGTIPETRTQHVEMARGPLLLRDWCPASLVQRLRADDGLVAFTRDPVRERDLLARVAAHPDSCLSLAHTPEGIIVGQVTICAPEGRWSRLDRVFELAFETSRHWRRTGLARQLLSFATAPPWVEETILIAEGYHWHWDLEGSGLGEFGYRDVIIRLLGHVGFAVERTDEPDIAASPANVFLVRIGSRVPDDDIKSFRSLLVRHSHTHG